MSTEGEPPICHTCKHVVARKEHRCDECHRTINPKESYWLLKGIWKELGAITHKMCNDCERARDSLNDYPDLSSLEEELGNSHPYHVNEWMAFLRRRDDGSLEEEIYELKDEGYLFDEDDNPICDEKGRHIRKKTKNEMQRY